MTSIGLRWKLALTHLLLVAVAAGLGALALTRLAHARRALDTVAARQSRVIELAVAGLSHTSELTRITYDAMLSNAPGFENALAHLRSHRAQGAAISAEIRASLASESARASFARVEAACARYGAVLDEVERTLRRNGVAPAAALLRGSLVPRRDEVDAEWRAFVSAQRDEIRTLADGAAAENGRAAREYVWIIAAATIGCVLLASSMTRHVVPPVTEMARFATQIAGGDVAGELAVTRRDELGDLQQAIAVMSMRLREFTERIRAAAIALGRASAHNWAAARQLREGTRAQLAGTAQVSASLEEMMAITSSLAEWLTDGPDAPTGMREAALGLPDRIAEVTRALRDFEAVAKSNDATARDLWAAADVAAQEARVLQDLAAWFRPNPAPRRRGEGAGAATPLSA